MAARRYEISFEVLKKLIFHELSITGVQMEKSGLLEHAISQSDLLGFPTTERLQEKK